MTRFNVEVTEILNRIVTIEADDKYEAQEIVERMYQDCTIVLDSSDYERTEFSVKDEK